MAKRKKKGVNDQCDAPQEGGDSNDSNAWVLTTKRAGDLIAGWQVESIYEDSIRQLAVSERCSLTSFCYPTGAKMVRARLQRADASASG